MNNLISLYIEHIPDIIYTVVIVYIAYAFVENLLYPDDDISSNVFWIILNWWSLYKYVHTKHAINLYENYPEDAKKQIFNYFLNWNGEYKESFKKTSRIHSDKNEECFVYIKDDLETIEVRDKELKLVGDKIPLISFFLYPKAIVVNKA